MAEIDENGAIDLTQTLAMPVAGSNTQAFFKPDLDESVETAEFEEEPESVKTSFNTVTVAPEGAAPGDTYTEQPLTLSPADLSVIFVNMLDGVQKLGLSFARKKAAFSAEELELIGGLDQSPNNIYEPGSREAVALQKWRKHLDAIQHLPFDEAEKKRLIDATTIYASTTQIKVTPLQGLIMAYGEVLGTRAINVFSDL